MKAWIAESLSSVHDLQWKEVAQPIPSSDEICIKIAYCALNFPDTLITEGKYQILPTFPFAPGAEISGIVVEIGKSVLDFKVGDVVCGGITWGGLSEYVCIKPLNIHKVPPQIPLDIASSIVMAYGTAYHALVDKAMISSGQVWLVLGGSGGVGMAAIQLLKLFGANIIVVCSESKMDFCKSMGADTCIDSDTPNKRQDIRSLSQGKLHGVMDMVGGEWSESALRELQRNGTFLTVGFTSGIIPSIPLNLVLLKEIQLKGVFWGNFYRNEPQMNRANINHILQWVTEGKLQPNITRRFAFSEAREALIDMKNRKVTGKWIVKVQT